LQIDEDVLRKYAESRGVKVDIDSLKKVANKFLTSILDESIKKVKLSDGEKTLYKSDFEQIKHSTYPNLKDKESEFYDAVDKIPSFITEEKKYIKWLHLSDFHIKLYEDYKTSPIFEALKEDIVELMKKHLINSFDFIIVTGDLAFYGKHEDYKGVKTLLDNIKNYTHTPKKRIFIVPGNHDVDRSIVQNQKYQLKSEWRSETEAENFLKGDKDVLNAFFKKFNGFSEFIRNFFRGKRSFTPDNYFSINILKIEGIQVALVGLNSCLKSGEDEEERNLMITKEQLNRALYESRKKVDLDGDFIQIPIKICFFHHPLDCINQNEIRNYRSRICKNFDFMLNGHIHDSAYDILNINNNYKIIKIVAGSTFIRDPGRGKQCYNIIKIDSKSLEGYGYFRRFEEGADYWTIDTSVGRGTGFVEVNLS